MSSFAAQDPFPSETDDVLRAKAGQGNWRAFRKLGLDMETVREAAEGWRRAVAGVEKGWLVWSVHPDWSVLQQKMVRSVGWTPIVGFDPRVTDVPVLDGSVKVDFNAAFGLPVMYPHFPLEFAFLWIDRLAFWHSDLLVRPDLLRETARRFEGLEDGACLVTQPGTGLKAELRDLFRPVSKKRYWELIGCTTEGASRSQYEHGAGWWFCFWDHPNCPDAAEYARRQRAYWDHGSGIRYWQKSCGGRVETLREATFDEGHFSKIRQKDFIRSAPKGALDATRSMQTDLERNFDLAAAARSLGLSDLTA